MKRLLLLLAMFSIGHLMAAQVQIDTLYYDKDWKGIEHPAFATYYRVTMSSKTESVRNRYRDFYMNGKMQGEGFYISIDPQDDSKSVFDGEYTVYYENGNKSSSGSYVNGQKEGLQRAYLENGALNIEVEYKNGMPNGQYKQYDEDGNVVVEAQMKEGVLNGPYYEYYSNLGITQYIEMKDGEYDTYELRTEDGFVLAFKKDGDIPIRKEPTEKDLHMLKEHGMPYYQCNGIAVGLLYHNVRDYGKYTMLTIVVENRLDTDVDFNPNFIYAEEQDSKKQTVINVLSADAYDKKIANRQGWLSFANALGNEFAANGAAYSSSTTTSARAGNTVSSSAGVAVGAYGSNTGYRASGAVAGVGVGSSSSVEVGVSTTTSYSGSADYWAKENARAKNAAYNSELDADRAAHQADYLTPVTLHRGETVVGYVMLPYTKKSVYVTIPINGIDYRFFCL